MQISSSERLRRSALAKEIKRILSAKSKQQSTFHHDTLLDEVRTASDSVSASTVVDSGNLSLRHLSLHALLLCECCSVGSDLTVV